MPTECPVCKSDAIEVVYEDDDCYYRCRACGLEEQEDDR